MLWEGLVSCWIKIFYQRVACLRLSFVYRRIGYLCVGRILNAVGICLFKFVGEFIYLFLLLDLVQRTANEEDAENDACRKNGNSDGQILMRLCGKYLKHQRHPQYKYDHFDCDNPYVE